jgi:hypothetical protein
MIIFLGCPQLQAMAPEICPPGAIGAELSQTPGVSSNSPLGETQQHHRHHYLNRDAAIVATENMIQDAHLK